MMVRADREITLADGRMLGYAEYGMPAGKPLVFCHGWPGSRLEAQVFDTAAAQLGLRLIAPDRPGMGLSDDQPDRTLSGWAADVTALADALGIERFSVLGIGGGGPHALAIAYHLPERVECAILAGAMGPLDVPGIETDLDLSARLGFALARRMPRLAEWIIRKSFSPVCDDDACLFVDRMAAGVPPQDRAVLEQSDVRQTLGASLRAAFQRGYSAAAREMTLLAQDWGFRLEQVSIPVYLFHGEADASVPVSMGRHQAVRLPRCMPRFYRDEAHFSLICNRTADILRPALRA